MDARFLKLIAAGCRDGGNRWVVTQARIFGDSEAGFTGDPHLNLVNAAAFKVNPVTLAADDFACVVGDEADFVDDTAGALPSTTMSQMSAGSWFTLDFGRQLGLRKFGFLASPGHIDPQGQLQGGDLTRRLGLCRSGQAYRRFDRLELR